MQHESIFLDHHFELSESELSQFERFLTIFREYNNHTNLSAIRDEAGIVEKHFTDSLYGAPVILELLEMRKKETESFRLLDIGSGGGFPGIPLKIVLPDMTVTLLDSVGKKVKAMNHFIQELGLTNITAIQDRAENLANDSHHHGSYDIIVSRATAYMTDILAWSVPFLVPGGRIILYKMPSEDERRDIQKITKKLGLILENEQKYVLGEKERILYIFAKK